MDNDYCYPFKKYSIVATIRNFKLIKNTFVSNILNDKNN